ncbi:phosphatase PAP2 family protein [Nocardia bovistercoris]|uniref:Phosphatase PAP2 family protein n=1 Tax=Nocardia bovistercoris TaxID=2785916 RepID=A0A931IFQ0_9NOCA|nr:phosphatase PAP2 family protein [Nocardia bovistercoris]
MIATLLVVFVAVLTHDVLRDSGLARIDPEISNWTVARRTDALTVLARTVTVLGDTLVLTVITTLVCAALLWRGHRRDALLIALTGIGASVLTFTGKRLVGRSRPPAVDRLAYEPSLSYPSGHSLGTMAVIGIMAVTLIPRLHRTAARIAAAAAAVIFVAAVGLSRIYLGVHWPTDVLAGWSIGALWVLTCVSVYAYAKRRSRADSGGPADTEASAGDSPPSTNTDPPHPALTESTMNTRTECPEIDEPIRGRDSPTGSRRDSRTAYRPRIHKH